MRGMRSCLRNKQAFIGNPTCNENVNNGINYSYSLNPTGCSCVQYLADNSVLLIDTGKPYRPFFANVFLVDLRLAKMRLRNRNFA